VAAAAAVPDVKLPVMPLSEREIYALTRSWKHIQKEIVETGIDMFLRWALLFARHVFVTREPRDL
jgi:hypothetical protein